MNMTDQHGETALMHAALMGSVKCNSLLLRSNAKINLRNNHGHNSIEKHITHISGRGYKRAFSRGGRGPFYPSKEAPLILLAAGEILSTSLKKYSPGGRVFTVDVPDFLQHDPELRFCLKHLCREAIRNHLITLNPHSHLFHRVPQLGLPSRLNSYLLYNRTLEDDSSS